MEQERAGGRSVRALAIDLLSGRGVFELVGLLERGGGAVG